MGLISRIALIFILLATANISYALRILIDIDSVIADFEQHAATKYKEDYPNEPVLQPKQRTEVDITKNYQKISKEQGQFMSEVLAEEEFCLTIPLIEGAKKALDGMTEKGHSVFLITSPLKENKTCLDERYDWVKENLGEEWVSRIVITNDKTIIKADFLIDDDPNIEGEEETPSWKQILFDQPYNQSDDKPRITKWKKWEDVVKSESK